MLESLSIQNYALIDKVQVQFSSGLNILSGETGAGKSILIGALGLLLGLKADTESIRSGCDEMVISGVVHLGENQEVVDWLEERSFSPEDQSIIIRRTVKKNGRGTVLLQSSPITITTLRELTGLIFDMHGQHEHQFLVQPENHRRLIDRYSGCVNLVKDFADIYSRALKAREKLINLKSSERERLRQIDLFRFSIQEIDEARLSVGEADELGKEHLILVNHEKLVNHLEEVYARVSENRGGGLADLRLAKSSMSELLVLDPELKSLSSQLEDAFYELEDFTQSIGQYRSKVAFDTNRLEQVEERVALIHSLKKKYGATIDEILAYGEQCRRELQKIDNWEEERAVLEAEVQALEREIRQIAEELTDRRKQAALILQKKIEIELESLGMPKVGFQVRITGKLNETGKPVYSNSGIDSVEFMISPNPGEPFKRLAQIASGGELSRIMLAIKSVLAESDHISTLIFDEIDAGIGGEVALAVGERLKKLSSTKQVLCITHLATLAVCADNHIKVEKMSQNGRTVTRANIVQGVDREEEIARMLAGDKKGEMSRKHALELLNKYGNA